MKLFDAMLFPNILLCRYRAKTEYDMIIEEMVRYIKAIDKKVNYPDHKTVVDPLISMRQTDSHYFDLVKPKIPNYTKFKSYNNFIKVNVIDEMYLYSNILLTDTTVTDKNNYTLNYIVLGYNLDKVTVNSYMPAIITAYYFYNENKPWFNIYVWDIYKSRFFKFNLPKTKVIAQVNALKYRVEVLGDWFDDLDSKDYVFCSNCQFNC